MAEKTKAKKNVEKEKICQTFDIGKKGEEKQVTPCGEISTPITKEQLEKQNKTLRNFLIVIGICAAFFIILYFAINSIKTFTYEGVDFKVVQEGELILYNTYFPLYSDTTGKHTADYNFYLRNDPRKLGKEIPFEGNLALLQNTVINSTEDFNCDGDGIISVANLILPFKVLGGNVVKNESLGCSSDGSYVFINIEPGNETEVVQTDVSCYSIRVKDCEILKATERFMLETFIEVNKYS